MVATEDAQAAVRFSDGAYARSVVACKASSPNMLNMGTYTNMRGIFYRVRFFVHYANSRNVNTWTPWSGYSELPSGYDLSADTINALPDGQYTFQIEYAHRVNGVWSYFSEYVPVFQYDSGWANMQAILNQSSLGSRTACVLGSSQIVIVNG